MGIVGSAGVRDVAEGRVDTVAARESERLRFLNDSSRLILLQFGQRLHHLPGSGVLFLDSLARLEYTSLQLFTSLLAHVVNRSGSFHLLF